MRIVVTGGTGLIGKAFSRYMVEQGHEITILSRHPAQYQAKTPQVNISKWDPNTTDWFNVVDGADAVINLASAGLADKRWSDARKTLIRESRIQVGESITAAIAAANKKPAVLLQASGVGYYGPQNNTVIDETHRPGSDFLSQVCIDWEQATEAVETMDVRRVIMRIGVVLATDGGALPRMLTPFKLFVGGPIGSGQQWFPWIDLNDLVRAMAFLLAEPTASGPFNLVAPNPLTNRDFSRAIGRTLHRPALFPVPAIALKLLFGEMSTVLLEGQRAVPHNLLAAGYNFKYPHADMALKALLQ